jgi:hypothetical protein
MPIWSRRTSEQARCDPKGDYIVLEATRKRARTLAPTLFLAVTAAAFGPAPAWIAQVDAQSQRTLSDWHLDN